jgi:hypothetical protein
MAKPALPKWRVSLAAEPEINTIVSAQYAYEAWQEARPDLLDRATAAGRVAEVAFADCNYKQIARQNVPTRAQIRERRAAPRAEGVR